MQLRSTHRNQRCYWWDIPEQVCPSHIAARELQRLIDSGVAIEKTTSESHDPKLPAKPADEANESPGQAIGIDA